MLLPVFDSHFTILTNPIPNSREGSGCKRGEESVQKNICMDSFNERQLFSEKIRVMRQALG